MARIELVTEIAAPIERCFDLSRDLDLHRRSMVHTGERAIGGRKSGLIGPDEEVTWRARHIGVHHEHTSRMTVYDRPQHFRDSMVRGRFRRFEHDHYFEAKDGGTVMMDVVDFASPLGPIGWIVDHVFLARYLQRLLTKRNLLIKHEAEGRTRGRLEFPEG